MTTQKKLSTLVSLVYDAAIDPSCWPVFLQEMISVCRGNGATIFFQDLSSQDGDMSLAYGLDPDLLKQYVEYYCYKNIWMIQAENLITEGIVLTSEMMAPRDVLMKSEFFHDFLRKLNVSYQFGGNILMQGPITSNISITRPEHVGPYDQSDINFLNSMMPHLKRALQVHQRIGIVQGSNDAALNALENLAIGILLLDDQGHATFVNQHACAIINQSDGLFLKSSFLNALNEQENANLSKLITNAARTSSQKGLHPGGQLLISRSSKKSPYGVIVSPIKREVFASGAQSSAVLIFIKDPDTDVPILEKNLQKLYGLSKSEVKLVRLLLKANDLRDAADKLGITYNTAHTQMANIFVKTGTSRQSELICVLSIPPK
jgi:DNA-binding CsgD family transcriptional regulator